MNLIKTILTNLILIWGFSAPIDFALAYSSSLNIKNANSQEDLFPRFVKIDSQVAKEKYADLVSVGFEPKEKGYSCAGVEIYFPSVRKGNGIKDISLISYDESKNVSMIAYLNSSPPPPRAPPEPGESLPPLTENDRNRIYFCVDENQLANTEIEIRYGVPRTLCLGGTIQINLGLFLTKRFIEAASM